MVKVTTDTYILYIYNIQYTYTYIYIYIYGINTPKSCENNFRQLPLASFKFILGGRWREWDDRSGKLYVGVGEGRWREGGE